MEMNINKSFIQKVFILFLCVYLALMPAFCYKRANAAFEKTRAYLTIATEIIMALRGVGFISDTTLTPENLTSIYNKADEYLHQNFGTELEYAEALRQVDQLGLDIASGQIFVPGNYSGKLWYSFLNAVVDVVWPNTVPDDVIDANNGRTYVAYCDGVTIYRDSSTNINHLSNIPTHGYSSKSDGYGGSWFEWGSYTSRSENDNFNFYLFYKDPKYGNKDETVRVSVHSSNGLMDKIYYNVTWGYLTSWQSTMYQALQKILVGSLTNRSNVPNLYKKTANKVKLPTRLPQTVINNINNYIDGSSENLIIAPTPDELPTLPDGYNPNTDDLINLPGYEDVTPDQEPTPTPTPEPTPEPTPTPTPPDYDGSSWIKPIGDFFAGLLSFLKDALIPSQTVDVTPLQNMGADVSGKFPFSLPGDIGKLFGVLNAEPIRPHFEMDFDLSKVGIPGEPIHWDLNVEQWDNGAAVVKTALYIAFLIGLVFITKQFMQN